MSHNDAKNAFGDALCEALTTTPLSKVTVSALARATGHTRQAFYYHFPDIASLTVWVFKRELSRQIDAHSAYTDWSDGYLAMLEWMRHHREETYSVVSTLSMEDFQLFLYQRLRAVIDPFISTFSNDLQLTRTDKNFVADHFVLAALGHLTQWIATDMKMEPHALTQRLRLITSGGVRHCLQILAQNPER